MIRCISLLLLLVIGLGVSFSASLTQEQPKLLPRINGVSTELLSNPGFEIDENSDKIPDGWTGKNTDLSRSDKLKCNQPGEVVAHSGNCAFIFRGNSDGSTSSLTQTITGSAVSNLTDGTMLQFSAYLDPRSATPGANFGKAKIVLSDGRKQTLKLAIPAEGISDKAGLRSRDATNYVLITTSQVLNLQGVTVVKLKVQFSSVQIKGKFLIDDVSLSADVAESTATPTPSSTDQPATDTPTVTPEIPTATPTSTPVPEPVKLVAGNTSNYSYSLFGQDVAIDGDFVFVGAPYEDNDPLGDGPTGAVYIFKYIEGTWVQYQRLVANSETRIDGFGYSIAVDGNTLLIHATGDGNEPGAVYIFTFNGNIWTQQQRLAAEDANSDDRFGISIALDGNTAIIGASQAKIGENDQQGAAYIFTYDGNLWTQQQKLTGDDGGQFYHLGGAVALTDNTAMIGGYGSSDGGRVYVFRYNGSSGIWEQKQKLTGEPGPGFVFDYFGISIGLSSDRAIIGEVNYAMGRGSVYLYTFDGDSWTQQQKITNDAGNEMDAFGISVALDGDHALIGALYDDTEVENQGAAYLYTYDGSTWSQYSKLLSPDGRAENRLGRAVALSGNRAMIGEEYGGEYDWSHEGAAWVFPVP